MNLLCTKCDGSGRGKLEPGQFFADRCAHCKGTCLEPASSSGDPALELDLTEDAIPEPEPAFPDEEAPTGKMPARIFEMPTPVAAPGYQVELSRLEPLPIPDEMKKPKRKR